MLITRAEPGDKAAIAALWQEYFAFDDDGYTAFFFTDGYQATDSYVLKNQEEIISCCSVAHHRLSLRGKIYAYAFIVGVITVKKYQRQGYMTELLNRVLTLIKEPLVLIQGYNPEIYYPFGFRPLYRRQRVMVSTGAETKAEQHTIIPGNSADMLKLYVQFVADKDGYAVRDRQYYDRLLRLNTAMERTCLLACDAAGEPQSYLLGMGHQEFEVQELIYREGAAIKPLLAKLTASRIILDESDAEICCGPRLYEKRDELLTLVKTDDKTTELFRKPERKLYFNEFE